LIGAFSAALKRHGEEVAGDLSSTNGQKKAQAWVATHEPARLHSSRFEEGSTHWAQAQRESANRL